MDGGGDGDVVGECEVVVSAAAKEADAADVGGVVASRGGVEFDDDAAASFVERDDDDVVAFRAADDDEAVGEADREELAGFEDFGLHGFGDVCSTWQTASGGGTLVDAKLAGKP